MVHSRRNDLVNLLKRVTAGELLVSRVTGHLPYWDFTSPVTAFTRTLALIHEYNYNPCVKVATNSESM
jgi:hypothetical protein